MNRAKTLIVGAGGLVGSTLRRRWRADGRDALVASHSAETEPDFTLDLSVDGRGDLPARFDGVSHAIICGAISKIDECFREPDRTGLFNVTHTIDLIDHLQDAGVTPIFCSSDAVFEGATGNYREDDPRHPVMRYGLQKAEVEDHLATSGRPYLVLRFGKLVRVAPDDTSPVGGTVRALRSGAGVKAAHDQYLSLTDVEDIATVTTKLIDAEETGVWHVAAPKAVTRLDMATAIAAFVGRPELVESVSIGDFTFDEPRPRNPVLNSDKIRARFDIEFNDPLSDLARF